MKYLLNEEFFQWSFRGILYLSWLLPILVACWQWNLDRIYEQKAILWFAAGSVLLEYISTEPDLNELLRTNFPFYHIGTPLLFWLVLRIYARAFANDFAGLRHHVIPIAFALLAIINACFIEGIMNFPNLTIGIYSLAGILLPILYMYTLLQKLSVSRLDRSPLFICSAGMLIYFSGNFLLWLFLTYINDDYELFDAVYRVNNVLTMLLNVFLAYAVSLSLQPKAKLALT